MPLQNIHECQQQTGFAVCACGALRVACLTFDENGAAGIEAAAPQVDTGFEFGVEGSAKPTGGVVPACPQVGAPAVGGVFSQQLEQVGTFGGGVAAECAKRLFQQLFGGGGLNSVDVDECLAFERLALPDGVVASQVAGFSAAVCGERVIVATGEACHIAPYQQQIRPGIENGVGEHVEPAAQAGEAPFCQQARRNNAHAVGGGFVVFSVEQVIDAFFGVSLLGEVGGSASVQLPPAYGVAAGFLLQEFMHQVVMAVRVVVNLHKVQPNVGEVGEQVGAVAAAAHGVAGGGFQHAQDGCIEQKLLQGGRQWRDEGVHEKVAEHVEPCGEVGEHVIDTFGGRATQVGGEQLQRHDPAFGGVEKLLALVGAQADAMLHEEGRDVGAVQAQVGFGDMQGAALCKQARNGGPGEAAACGDDEVQVGGKQADPAFKRAYCFGVLIEMVDVVEDEQAVAGGMVGGAGERFGDQRPREIAMLCTGEQRR